MQRGKKPEAGHQNVCLEMVLFGLRFVRIVFDWGLPFKLRDAGIFSGGNGNSIWKVEGNGNEYEREWESVHGNGREWK